MIRVNYPIPPLAQLRLRLELAARRTRRTLEARRRSLRASRRRQDLYRERRAYAEFYDQYDALVGLLCLAAHEGVTPVREEEYRTRRAWFCQHYPVVKHALGAHLAADESDAAPGRWGRRACDGFEALFFPASIAAMLAADGGNLIGRLMRTQAALGGWEESIAQREKACGDQAV